MKEADKRAVWRQCKKKRRYKDEHHVRQAIKWCKKQRDVDLDYYWCCYCNGYHITHNQDVRYLD